MPVYRTLIVLLIVILCAIVLTGDGQPRVDQPNTGERFLAHLSTDKPIYRAGETVYIRGAILGANERHPLPPDRQSGGNVQITGPKGDIVANGYASIQDSVAAFTWVVPDGTAGGQFTAKLTFPWLGFAPAERQFEVRAYRAPRLKGEIIFLREGYGAGDTVKATMKVERAEGGIPAGAKVTATAIVDGTTTFSGETKVETSGTVSVDFKLPTQITRGDGTLAIAIADGGAVETISKTIPILVRNVELSLYPEGGELIAGLASRVYIEARTPNQKPADIVGAVIDSTGATVAELKTEHEGRGRFDFTPKAGETYSIKLSQPTGIEKPFALPTIKRDGVSLMSEQLVTDPGESLKLSLCSTVAGAYTVRLSKHTVELASVSAKLPAGKSKAVELTPPAWADGVLVATVTDGEGKPVAERLVFRKPSKSLHVTVTPDRSSYTPAGAANVTVKTTDENGKPISAVVGITATDESVLQLIEKRERHPRLPAMVLLEDDVKELADADIYLNPTDPKSALAVDLLLGTQGWRRFATAKEAEFLEDYSDAARRVLADVQPPPPTQTGMAFGGAGAVDAVAATAAPAGMAGQMRNRFIFAEKARDKDRSSLVLAKSQPAASRRPIALDQRQLREEIGAGGGRRGGMIDMEAEGQILQVVRVYAHDLQPGHHVAERTDFAETLYWCAAVRTDAKDGTAKVAFKLNDSVTSFKVSADAFDESGALGEGSAIITSVQPFYIEPKLPLEVTSGDVIQLPISAVNGTPDALSDVKLAVTANEGNEVSSIDGFTLNGNARDRKVSSLRVGKMPMQASVRIRATAGSYADDVTRPLSIKPLGFPIEVAHGGMIDANSGVSHTIEMPASVVPGSIVTHVALYPTPLANMTDALKRLMQEPNGCFEQTSSTTYPLVMADQYFMSHTGVDPELIAKSNELLAKGYDKLKGFECKNKGYEWFGSDPGHECLSAFGLLEFTDMAQVREVDPAMLKNTREWLLARRDGKGGYSHERRALHTWIADPGCANGYTTWALLECGEKKLDTEVNWLKEQAAKDDNSYVTALAANVLHLAGDCEGAKSLMNRLNAQQDKDGHVNGAKTTVVGSGGEALQIETTALATLAWLRDPSFAGNVERAIKFLSESCKAGRFGSTQSTVLALRAIVAYDKSRAHPTATGKIQLLVDGRTIGDAIAFDANTHGAIELPDLASALTPGKHEVALKMSDGSSLPYALAVSYNSVTPASSDECKLRIETTLRDSKIVEGAPSEANVTVTNVTDEVQPSPIAIVGLPGGMEVRHDQLKELVRAERIAAYEVRGREVILYWRDIQPKEKVQIPLSVVAAVPGTYTAPASRAYLYYTDEFKQWAAGMKVEITAK